MPTSFGCTWNRNDFNPELRYHAPTAPMREADDHQRPGAAQHHRHDVRTRRAKRHADADLVGALGHHVGHHAVDADGSDHQSEHAEERQYRHVEAPLSDQAIHVALERDRVADQPLLGIDGPDRGFHPGRAAIGSPAVRMTSVAPKFSSCAAGR